MIVADTHIIIWNALKPEMLSRKAEKAISAANNSDGIIFCDIISLLFVDQDMLHRRKFHPVDPNYI